MIFSNMIDQSLKTNDHLIGYSLHDYGFVGQIYCVYTIYCFFIKDLLNLYMFSIS